MTHEPSSRRSSRRMYHAASVILGSLACVGSNACSGISNGDGGNKPITGPHVVALSTYSARLGTPVNAFMQNPPAASSKVELVFRGTFLHADGHSDPVDVTQETTRLEAGAVRWTQFGPFLNPLSPAKADIGVFTGKVGVRVTNTDGSTTEDEVPQGIRFEVLPSLVIEDFQPTTAACHTPARRAFGGMSYKLRARALGFKPTNISYIVQTPSVLPDNTGNPTLEVGPDGNPIWNATRVDHTTASNVDIVDGKDAFSFPEVPTSALTYGVIITALATDASGRQIATTFGMNVHRPIETFYDGRYQLAQLYPPELITGGIPGGKTGTTVTYSDTNTESKSRQLTLTLSSNWLHEISSSQADASENTWSTSNGKDVSRSTTDTSGWSNTKGTSNTDSTDKTNTFDFTRSGSSTNGSSTSNGSSSGTGSSSGSSSGTSGSSSIGVNYSDAQANGTTSSNSTGVNGSTAVGFKGNGGINVGIFSAGGEANHTSTKGTSQDHTNGTNSTNTSTTGGDATNTAGYNQGTSSGTSSMSGTSHDQTNSSSNTNGWSQSNGGSTSVGHSTTQLSEQTLSGSEATTDTTSVSQVKTVGGSTSQTNTNGTSNSTGGSQDTSNAWVVSSAQSISQGYSASVIPNGCGAWYRQAARYQREAFVLIYDKCGDGEVVGQLTMQDYVWAVDLAQGASCSPAPATDFPEAQCLLPPCDGQ